MAADGNGEFLKALGLCQDLTGAGLGPVRAKRFALIIDNSKVTYVGVEPGDPITLSGAQAVLEHL